MTSKQRFTAAAEHSETDRVPVGEHWVPHTLVEQIVGVERSHYNAWGYAQIAFWEGQRDEVVDQMKEHYVEFIRRTGLDMATVELVPPKNWEFECPKRLGEGLWEDATGSKLQWYENVHDIMVVEEGTKEAPHEPHPEPDGSEWEFWDHVVKELGETHFIMAVGIPLYPHDYCRVHLGRSRFDSFQNLMYRIKEDPDSIAEAQVKQADSIYEGSKLARERGADAMRIVFDYGCSTGPYCSPEDFRRAFLPGLKAHSDAVRRAGLISVLHVDGSVEPVIDQIAEGGPDIYQAVQGYEPMDEYKRAVGDDLAFWGNVDNDRLARGTPEEIRSLSRWAIQNCKQGGGFILGSAHDVLLPTPKENFMAMVETVFEDQDSNRS
ncbi:MAG: uroporphyrinogen decarboxylase family protein, partial [Planctomycetota bacterium]|nr:uroporphyrinogen decarboxylase family protein [Planctomycetota bacterium]